MEVIKWLMNDGEWLVYGFIYLYIIVSILRLLIYLYRVNFTNYDPWE
jgi:hypothetical protein